MEGIRYFLILLLLISFNSFANETRLKEIETRLEYIDKEVANIESYIQSGEDPAPYKPYLDGFSEEKKKLLSEKQGLAPASIALVAKKKAKKTAWKPKKKWKKNRTPSAKAKRGLAYNVEPETSEAGSHNWGDRLNFNGHFRWRYRTANSTGYKAAFTNFHDMRFRAGVNVKANDITNLYFETHLDKNVGGRGGFTGNNGNTGVATSASGNDDLFGVHQAYASIKPLDKTLEIKVGRQMLKYGDQLVISPLEWDNTGRVFDAVKTRYTNKKGWVDFWYSVLDQGTNVTTTTREDDDEFTGIYSSHNFGKWFKALDVYALYRTQRNVSQKPKLSMGGVRVKSKPNAWDYRFEATLSKEGREGLQSKGGWQINPELGYSFKTKGMRLAAQYFAANEHYIQLYPLAHGFLGYADMFGRRNIKGYAAHFKIVPFKNFIVKIDYHTFKRRVTDVDAFKANGVASYSSTSTSDDLGTEIDVTAIWKFAKKSKLVAGLASFSPGDYIEKSSGAKNESYGLGYLIYQQSF